MMLGSTGEIVVEREHGNVNGDVVVNGDIGIEMKRNLSNSQTKKLRGQIEEYQKEYTHVIALACGVDDMDGWRKLKNDYQNQMGMGMDPDAAPVKFIQKKKSDYGEGVSADQYDRADGGQAGDGVEELASVLEDGVRGYQSLTGDGNMESSKAIASVAKAVFVVGFLLVLLVYMFVTFV